MTKDTSPTPSELNEAVERLRKLSDIADKNATPFVPCGPADLAALIAFYDARNNPTPPQWPIGCKDTASCEKHKTCMYIGCAHQGQSIEGQINALLSASAALPLPEGE